MLLTSVIGTRPNYVKVRVLDAAAKSLGHLHRIIDTGQHYDRAMIGGFPRPDVVLRKNWTLPHLRGELGGNAVIVYGDTDSTVYGATAASLEGIPVVHVEAGCRSRDPSMPEERNRIFTDKVASLRLAPTKACSENLWKEGLSSVITGDVMLDAYTSLESIVDDREIAAILAHRGLERGGYCLVTLHRQSNVENVPRLAACILGISDIPLPVYWMAHHRTMRGMREMGFKRKVFCEAATYEQMHVLIRGAYCVVTDSGGVTRECYFAGVPCYTLRDRTEWPETLEGGWNRLTEPEDLAIAVRSRPTGPRSDAFGDGKAGLACIEAIERWV